MDDTGRLSDIAGVDFALGSVFSGIVSLSTVSIYEIVLLLSCFLLSGFFSGSEAVLMSLGIDRAKQLIGEGGKKAKAMTIMIEKPSELLSTILIGNNIVNLLAASLTTVMAIRVFQSEVVGISTGVVTIIILIFGEALPKAFARAHAEKISVTVIHILNALHFILYPLVKAMAFIIHTVLGKKAELSTRLVTKSDLEYMISKAEQEKSIDSKHLNLLSSILEFPNIRVKDVMIPRSDVKFLKSDTSFKDIIAEITDDIYSRYPVCEGTLDDTIGLLHVKDLALIRGELKQKFNLKNLLKEPFFVYENMKIQAVFDHMNRKKVHMALVKDESGLIVGIITLEDIVEEIMGEIQDEHDEDEQGVASCPVASLPEGVVLDASMPIRDLHNDYDIKIPLSDNYSTLAGFVLDMLGNNLPEQGQIIIWQKHTFELHEVEDSEVKSVCIKGVDGSTPLLSNRENGGSKYLVKTS